MLARSTESLPATRALAGGCLYEPKWDGYRGLVGVDAAGTARIRSRRGTDLTASFPDITSAAVRQLPAGTLLDGELVVWSGDRLDVGELQRRMIAPGGAAARARLRPASYVAFDLLALAGRDLTGEPLRTRRHALERLLPDLAPPLQVTPATRDRGIAEEWLRLYADAQVGIEGLVVKGLADTYRPGRRGWLKLKSRETAEAVVGAVTGSIEAPERLILGLPDAAGRLLVAGATGPLRPLQRATIAPFLAAADEAGHPWPPVLPAGRIGVWGGAPIAVALVVPSLVVEISADAATTSSGHWRHLVRLVRARPELHPDELLPDPGDGPG